LKVYTEAFTFKTRGPIDLIDITDIVQKVVVKSQIKNGIAHIFAPHATGIVILTENEPNLLDDIRNLLEKLVPERGNYGHPSNAHAHLRSVLLPPDKTIPIVDGKLALGTWQSIMFVETDIYPRTRTIIVTVMGE